MKQFKQFLVIMSLLIPMSSMAQWEDEGWLSEGLAYVKDSNGKYGYIDEDGKVVIPCKWKEAWSFDEGLAQVQDDNEKWGLIDKTGK